MQTLLRRKEIRRTSISVINTCSRAITFRMIGVRARNEWVIYSFKIWVIFIKNLGRVSGLARSVLSPFLNDSRLRCRL